MLSQNTLGITTALILGAVVLYPLGCTQSQRRPASDAEILLRRAVKYLWSRQDADGGWHSSTHGIVKGGEAWTPFTAFYLLQVPDSIYTPPAASVEAALAFIRDHVSVDGVVGVSNSAVLEYPNYATSYALRVLRRWGRGADTLLVRRMSRYLAAQQFVESRGIAAGHRAYGGWGFGETTLQLGEIGHVDLSHTRRVLEAVDVPDLRDLHSKAQHYLRMLQKHPSDGRLQPGADPGDPPVPYDGGFYSSTTALGMNKAGLFHDTPGDAPAYFYSYATATCDGVLALLAGGVSRSDERVRSGAGWLAANGSLETVDGIAPGSPGDWDQVLFFYHLLVRSEVYVALGVDDGWQDAVQKALAGQQRHDGSFSNPMGAANKEDDPILATTMAVGTLLNSMR